MIEILKEKKKNSQMNVYICPIVYAFMVQGEKGKEKIFKRYLCCLAHKHIR